MSLRLDYPTYQECRWLVQQGVDPDALAQPTPIRAAPVRFFRHAFDLADDGERALIFTEERDAVAWQPRLGRLASWRGAAFALNEEAIFNPATWLMGGALRIHHSPLEWLQADREGIVIVQPRLTFAMLRHCPRLLFASAAHARQVRGRLEHPPKITTEFLIVSKEEKRAA